MSKPDPKTCEHEFTVPIILENMTKNAQGEYVPTNGLVAPGGFPNVTVTRKLMCRKGCGETIEVKP